MAISDFSEKDIRNKILEKIKPKLQPGKHDKGYIWVDGILVGKVKIPNNHSRIMKEKKSQYIALSLRLSDEDFNDLIICHLTGPGYYKKLKAKGL
jgi:hypothetical protein